MPPLKKRLPVAVLAYFRLGEDDPGAAAGKPVGEETVNHAGPWPLKKYGAPRYAAGAAAAGSTLAVNFTGADHECFFRHDLFQSPIDNFILEAWVRPNRIANYPTYVVCNGSSSITLADGYGLLLAEDGWVVHVPWAETERLGIPYTVGEWVHVALVRDRGSLQLWLNGRLAKDLGGTLVPRQPSGPFAIGGQPESVVPDPKDAHSFDGEIDEVRLSEFGGAFTPDMLLFQEPAERRK